MEVTRLKRCSLGRTGLHVSPIGLGTVKFGRTVGVRYPTPFELPTDAEIDSLLALAHQSGINLLDTAPAYGAAEERLGKALIGQRDRWVLCTKVGEHFDGSVSRFDYSPRAIRSSVENSLSRLGTEAVDIILIHSNGEIESSEAFVEALSTLDSLKAEGKLRAAGASTKTVAGGVFAASRCDVVMVTLNKTSTDDLDVIERAAQVGTGVLIKKSLGSGYHAHDSTDDAQNPVRDAMRFALAPTGVHSLIMGTINPVHLCQNIQAALEVLAEIDSV